MVRLPPTRPRGNVDTDGSRLELAMRWVAPLAWGLRLPSTWGSRMVLQQGVPVPVWGTDAPGAAVSISYRGASLGPFPAGATGRWEGELPAAPAALAGTTVVFASSTGARVELDDVVVGDVYVCPAASLHP